MISALLRPHGRGTFPGVENRVCLVGCGRASIEPTPQLLSGPGGTLTQLLLICLVLVPIQDQLGTLSQEIRNRLVMLRCRGLQSGAQRVRQIESRLRRVHVPERSEVASELSSCIYSLLRLRVKGGEICHQSPPSTARFLLRWLPQILRSWSTGSEGAQRN